MITSEVWTKLTTKGEASYTNSVGTASNCSQVEAIKRVVDRSPRPSGTKADCFPISRYIDTVHELQVDRDTRRRDVSSAGPWHMPDRTDSKLAARVGNHLDGV